MEGRELFFLMGDKRRIEKQRDRFREALERIAYEKERQPVRKTTGVSGEPRYLHAWPSRCVALEALGELDKEGSVT
jgi:hypothetical protein